MGLPLRRLRIGPTLGIRCVVTRKDQCLYALESCGCTAWASVLGYGHDDDAYREAAREAKRGLVIVHDSVDAWKARDMFCEPHREQGGPDHWSSVRKYLREQKRKASKPIGMGL